MKHPFSNWDWNIIVTQPSTALTVRRSNPCVGEIFRIRTDRPWGRPSSQGMLLTTHISADVKKRIELHPYCPLGLNGVF